MELMKGQKWSDRYLKGKLRFSFPCIVEEKRDEIRAHFKLVRCKDSGNPVNCEVVSYAGKPLYNLETQCEQLFAVMLRHGLAELDCGIEVNGNFDDSYRWVRTKKGIPKGLEEAKVVVLLFDVPESKLEYGLRLEYMREIIQRTARLDFQRPAHWVAEDEMDIDFLYANCRRRGVEGVMVKTIAHLYERTRSWNWFKRKPDEPFDGRITGVNEALCGTDQPHLGLRVGDRLARTGSVDVCLEDGSVASPHGIPHYLGKDMHANPEKYIGQWCEFSCMEVDRQGGYRHPIFKRLREAKE
jgi:hypothetical protein